MKKKLCFLMMAVFFLGMTACSDDDDDKKEAVAGTYTGTITVTDEAGTPIGEPLTGQKITIVDAGKDRINLELKDFKFGELVIGDITANCKATLDKEGDDFDLNGQTTLTVAALGNVELPIVIEGEVDAKELDIDINITNVPLLNTLKVEFEGTK